MANSIEFRNSYYPCKHCNEKGIYNLMYFDGIQFQCRKGHYQSISEHLINCSFEDLIRIIRELLQEREEIDKQWKSEILINGLDKLIEKERIINKNSNERIDCIHYELCNKNDFEKGCSHICTFYKKDINNIINKANMLIGNLKTTLYRIKNNELHITPCCITEIKNSITAINKYDKIKKG